MQRDTDGSITFENAELFSVAIGLNQYAQMDAAHAPDAAPTAAEAVRLSKQADQTYREADADEQAFGGQYNLNTNAVRTIAPDLRRELTLAPDAVEAVAVGLREVHKGLLSVRGVAKALLENPRAGLVRLSDRRASKRILKQIA